MLNNDQLQAIKIINQPLLIIAGAGTGKTTVIVEKIKYLILKKKVKPENIVALTFTEKAAQEMEERVDQALPLGYFQMWINTFHSFADQILRKEIVNLGITPDYQILNDADSLIFFRKNFYSFDLKYYRPITNPNRYLPNILNYFNRLKEENISPEKYLNWIQKKLKKTENRTEMEELQRNLELALAYKKYQEIKSQEGVLEFSDLVYYLTVLFKKNPHLLKKYQEQFQYILVDEFQDTSLIQYQLIKMLAPANNNPQLTVVGDDSQSIYKFRGASISNIINFIKDYPNAKKVNLIKNYRSNQIILDAAYKLIKNNDPDTLEAKLGISKRLIATREITTNPLNFYLAETVEDEADFIVKKIIEYKNQYRYSDFAILVRANNHIFPFINALSYKGIPYQILGAGALFKQPEIKDLIALVKLITNPEDSGSAYRLLTLNFFQIDTEDIHLLITFAQKINQPLLKAIEIYLSYFYPGITNENYKHYYHHLPLLKKETKEKIYRWFILIREIFNKVKTMTPGQLLYYFLEKSQYLKKIINPKTEKEEIILLNISKFFDHIKTFEITHEDHSIFDLNQWLELTIELGDSPSTQTYDKVQKDAVNILTVHSAKGLEFPIVFLVNLSQGRFPIHKREEIINIPKPLIKEILPKGDYHLQEERRLFYVGITRAKDKLFLSCSKFYYEGKRQRKISKFVFENLEEKKIKELITREKELKEQINLSGFKLKEEIIKKPTVTSQEIQKKFTYTELETFNTCPLQYKYYYILKIPTTPNANESFGTTIHKTLEKFYLMFLKNKEVSVEELLNIYEEQWIPIGYSSRLHEKRMKQEGRQILINFFKKHHKPNVLNLKILELEKKFNFKINNYIITGKIDRIDKKENQSIELIDYKTGKKLDKNELEKSLQVGIYTLAAIDKNILNIPLNKVIFSFYFLQHQEKVTLNIKEQKLKKIVNKILETIKKINENKFPPRIGPWCDFCPFRIICEAW